MFVFFSSLKIISLLFFLAVTFLSCEATKNRRELLNPPTPKKVVLQQKRKVKSDVLKKRRLRLIMPYRKAPRSLPENLSKYCQKMDKKFYQYGWGKSKCHHYRWKHVRSSFWGNPIPWVVYGVPESKKANTTIVLCGVHGDEITPVKFCYDVMRHLNKNIHKYKNSRVVVAPLVTPDSFFKKYPTRTNAKGVDVNRNFPTRDWSAKAHHMWRHRYGKSKRRFPGEMAKSEQEVHFQVNLINRYRPNKIISVHAPLTILDYDGPKRDKSSEANALLIQMSKNARDYKIKNYPFFPGSLGNWAGNERNIPTYTLELPTSDNRHHKKHWALFEKAISLAIGRNLSTPSKQ